MHTYERQQYILRIAQQEGFFLSQKPQRSLVFPWKPSAGTSISLSKISCLKKLSVTQSLPKYLFNGIPHLRREYCKINKAKSP